MCSTVVDVGVEAVRPAPLDRLAHDRRREALVVEDPPDPAAERRRRVVGRRRRADRHRADDGPLVPDDRLGEPQPVRVQHRRRRHPARGERHPDAALRPRPGSRRPSGPRSGSRGRRSCRRCRARAAGSAAAALASPPAGGSSRSGSRLGERVRGLDAGEAGEPGEVVGDATAPARQPRRDLVRDRLAVAGPDLEERDAVRRERPGSASSNRRTTSRPSGPPSSASDGSNESSRARPSISPVGTYGRLAHTTLYGGSTWSAAGPPP